MSRTLGALCALLAHRPPTPCPSRAAMPWYWPFGGAANAGESLALAVPEDKVRAGTAAAARPGGGSLTARNTELRACVRSARAHTPFLHRSALGIDARCQPYAVGWAAETSADQLPFRRPERGGCTVELGPSIARICGVDDADALIMSTSRAATARWCNPRARAPARARNVAQPRWACCTGGL